MGYDIGWIIPRLRSPGALWSCASSLTVAVVGLFSKIIIEWLNKTTVYNGEALRRAVWRPNGVPLLTVSNHHSCFDDPGLWGVLECGVLLSARRMRWSLAAHDICFTRALHAAFFALGKCVPCVRGAGVHQPAIDFCIERLAAGDWVHIFPEGRVNVDKEHIRFKWGVGRMVAESWAAGRAPVVLPVWHEGLDQVLPNKEPYLLQFRKRAVLSVGEPIRLHTLLEKLQRQNASEEQARAAITARIQNELLRLREKTHRLLPPDLQPCLNTSQRTDILVKPSELDEDDLDLELESNGTADHPPDHPPEHPPAANGKQKERLPEKEL